MKTRGTYILSTPSHGASMEEDNLVLPARSIFDK